MLIDNKSNGTVFQALQDMKTEGGKLSILSGVFTIYAFNALKKELLGIQSTQILLTNLSESIQSLVGGESDTGLINNLDQKRVAQECLKWLKQKELEIGIDKSVSASNNLICVQKDDDISVIQGSASFSPDGLGVIPSANHQMNMLISDSLMAKQLLNWFDTVWNDVKTIKNVKEELINKIENLAINQPLEIIYFLTLFNIFNSFLEDLDQEKLLRNKTGFKDSIVWNKLFKFQKDGVW